MDILTDDDFNVAPAKFKPVQVADPYLPLETMPQDAPASNIAPASKSKPVASQQNIKRNLNISKKKPTINADLATTARAASFLQNFTDVDDALAVNDNDDNPLDGIPEDAPEETALVLKDITNSLTPERAGTEWYPLPATPNYMGMKKVAKTIFKQFTSADLSEIYSVSTLTTPEDQVKRIYKALADKGRFVEDLSYDFAASIPGYEAEAKLYSYKGMEFLLVKDFAGYYVYAWDSSTSKITSDSEESREALGMIETLLKKRGFKSDNEQLRKHISEMFEVMTGTRIRSSQLNRLIFNLL